VLPNFRVPFFSGNPSTQISIPGCSVSFFQHR
jgi:hypothetical protein